MDHAKDKVVYVVVNLADMIFCLVMVVAVKCMETFVKHV